MSDLTAPLRQLLKKNVEWNWSNSQSEAYVKLKYKIQEATILKIFDPSVPVEIFVDASNYALGACLMQNKHPVAFSSRTLTDAETRYPVIDKEMAAICFAVSKYHNYIYGNTVTVYTDHKPIIGIMEKSMFNVSGRLQKLKIKLLNYNLKIKYLPGKDNVLADILSRFSKVAPVENENILDKSVVVHSLSNQLNMSDQKKQEFRLATDSDPVLSRVKEYVQKGWPDIKKITNKEERMYFNVRDEIFYEDGLLFLGHKVLVPQKLRQCMLNLIHEAHLGVNKCKARARTILYWPNMSTDIETVVLSCKICEKFRFTNEKEPLMSHPSASRPWERVSCDLFDFGGASYLTVIDSYSNWIEVERIANKSAYCVIEKLKIIFSRFGVPDYFLSDNVPFSSSKFKSFAHDWNFQTITSSPHYPRCNGLAEKSVSICKNLLRRSASSHKDLAFLLLEYRNSPLNRVNASPAQLFLNRMLKSKLPTSSILLKPMVMCKVSRNNTNEYHYNKSACNLSEFERGSNVLIRKFGPQSTWVPGEVVEKLDAPRSYIVRDEDGREYRRNRSMLRKSLNKVVYKTSDDAVGPISNDKLPQESNGQLPQDSNSGEIEHPEEVVGPTSRVGRQIRKPKYLQDYVY